jgi:uncharacterized membrane protein
MNRKSLALASTLLVATMVAAAVAIGLATPADLMLPIHWGIDGTPDRLAGKWTALLLPPLFTALLSLFFYTLPALEPRRHGLGRSQGLYLWGWVGALIVFAAIAVAVASEALGWQLPVPRLITVAVGAMLVLIGNQLGKSRSMYLIGIRTPWTLASEEVWIRTHRLGGKLMVVAGAGLVAAATLAPQGALAAITLALVALAALIPVAFSYLLWRREQRGDQPSG